MLYLVQAGDDGPVKIGLAKDVRRRVAGMQTTSPVEYKILRVLHGGRSEEMALHKQFAAQRIRGEWFTFHPDMLADMQMPEAQELPSIRSRRPRSAPLSKFECWRREAGLSLDDVADKLGIVGLNPGATVHKYATLKRLPPLGMLRKIIALTGGAVGYDDWPDEPVGRQPPPVRAEAA